MKDAPLGRAFAIVGIGVAVRRLALELAHPQHLVGDERYYVEVAANLAEGPGHLFERDVVVNAAARFRVPILPILLADASYAALHAPAVAARLHGGAGGTRIPPPRAATCARGRARCGRCRCRRCRS